ncbi:hypothetical protein SKAU_G00096240 [Synaphobranchus kaupii]|uniref:Uncharacterized protein n=1 Tax=Synaphobranchus kaupii TaxID=118154 RepID=A0A9Q1FXP7_SYNKA|nr:hypothetical protein SKAU_G00096240 [Synaphobranchus kaupii]
MFPTTRSQFLWEESPVCRHLGRMSERHRQGPIELAEGAVWEANDLQNLITTLPEIQDGAAIWIRKLEEEMTGKTMTLGDVKALLTKQSRCRCTFKGQCRGPRHKIGDKGTKGGLGTRRGIKGKGIRTGDKDREVICRISSGDREVMCRISWGHLKVI